MAWVIDGGKARRRLVDELRGLIGDASLRDVPVELHRRPQDGGADLFRLPGGRVTVGDIAGGHAHLIRHHGGDGLEARNRAEQLAGDLGMRFVQASLFMAQRLATEGARQRLLRQVMQPSCEIIAARWYCHMPGSSDSASAALSA